MKRSLKETINKKAPSGKGAPDAGELPEDVRELAGKYRGMNESQLMDALMSETRKRKAEGSYDPASIQSGVNALLPMLNEEQKRKLFEIIGRMDRQ
jgi:hypothetical protein